MKKQPLAPKNQFKQPLPPRVQPRRGQAGQAANQQGGNNTNKDQQATQATPPPPPPSLSAHDTTAVPVNQCFRVLRISPKPTTAVRIHFSRLAFNPTLLDGILAELTVAAVLRMQPTWRDPKAQENSRLASGFVEMVTKNLPTFRQLTNSLPCPLRVPKQFPVTSLAAIRRPPPHSPLADHFFACLYPKCDYPVGADRNTIKVHVLTEHYHHPYSAKDDDEARKANPMRCFPNADLYVLEHPRMTDEQPPDLWDEPLAPVASTSKRS